MEILGNVDFGTHGGAVKRMRVLSSDMPVDPKIGEFVFRDRRLYLCVDIDEGTAFYLPLTQELTTYRHDQASPALEWTVEHNLGVNLATIQVFDTQGRWVIPDEIDCSLNNQATVKFSVPTAGHALVMYGDQFAGGSRPQVGFEDQFTSSLTWTINHGLGYFPSVTCFVDGYVIVPESIEHPSAMQTIVTFSVPRAGLVRCI